MNIGIDVDNTIAPTFKTIVKYMNKKYNLNKKHKSSKKPTGYDLFHSDFDSFYDDWKEFVESYDHKKMKPITGSSKIIQKLSVKNNIYIITARESNQRMQTVLWIDKNYKNKFEEILFLDYDGKTPLITKGDLCKKFNIDVMIEDDPYHVDEIIEKNKNIKILLFDKNNKYNWSKVQKNNKNVIRVLNWKAVEKEIKKIESSQ